jgi:hypothetical protein
LPPLGVGVHVREQLQTLRQGLQPCIDVHASSIMPLLHRCVKRWKGAYVYSFISCPMRRMPIRSGSLPAAP